MVKKNKKKVIKKKTAPKLTEDEREELKQEGELPKKRIRDIENKQLIGFFVVVMLVFAAFLIPFFYVKSQKTFDYIGLSWNILEENEITFFYSKVPIIYKGKVHGASNVFLRNDPRQNNIDTEFEFSNPKNVYISHTEESASCYGQSLVSSLLSQFYSGFPFVENIEGAAATDSFGEKYGHKVINCVDSSLEDLVVLIKQGDESRVYTDAGNPNCIIVESSDCSENLLVAESLVIEVLRQLEFVKVKWN